MPMHQYFSAKCEEILNVLNISKYNLNIFRKYIFHTDLNKSTNVLSETFDILIEFFSMEGEYIFDDLQMLHFTSKNI